MTTLATGYDVAGNLLVWGFGALFVVNVTLVGFIGRHLFTSLNALDEKLDSVTADAADTRSDVKLARTQLADHLRWSRSEHRKLDQWIGQRGQRRRRDD